MPLPKKLSRTINKFAKKDGKIAKKFHPYIENAGDLKLYVLAQYGTQGIKWHILGVIDKWSAEFDKFRDRTTFSISTTREDFGVDETETFFQIANRASHIAKGNGEVYSIRDGDTVQSFQFDFAYKIYGQLQSQTVFELEFAEMEPLI